jgi:hypothetical protein
MLKTFELAALAAAIVLLFSLAGVGYLSSPPSGHPSQQQTTTNSKHEEKAEEGHSVGGFFRYLFPDGIAVFTFWLVIATILLGVVAVLQIGYLDRAERIAAQSAKAAKDSAEVARDTLIATNRPWLSVTLDRASDLVITNAKEARVSIIFRLKNTGHSPALNAHVTADIVPIMSGGGRMALDDMKEICDRVRDAPQGKNLIGHTIFPGDTFDMIISMSVTRDKFESLLKDIPSAKDIPETMDFFVPVVVGCVSYRLPFADGNHVTEFYADLRKNNPQTPNVPDSFKWADGNVPLSQLLLMRSFTGGNAD